MNDLISLFKAPEFWGVFIPAFVAVIVFFLTERSKLMWEQYKRKEESYARLLKFLRGFYVVTPSREQKQSFIDEINQCWLYAPDDVIKKAYHFLESVHTGQKTDDREKEKRVGELVTAIRLDLLKKRIVKKSNLTSDDFRHLRAT